MKQLFILTLFLSIVSSTYSQKYRNSGLFLDTHITQGKVLKSNDFVRGENRNGTPINDFSATDLRIGWQTRGSEAWHHALNLPYYGLGVYNMVFSNEEELGYPAALYFFFGAPFSRKEKSSFDYEFSFGLSYNWTPYNDIDNPFNLAIGSYENAYIDAKIKYEWYFSKRFSLNTGFRVTHFSNGAIRHPNAGINLLAPFLGVRYDILSKDPISIDQLITKEVETTNEFNILIASGKRAVKGTTTNNNQMVSLLNVSLEYLKPAGSVFKYGGSIDVGIDENRNIQVFEDDVELSSTKKQIYTGVSAIGQFRANRLGVQAAMGYEFINNGKLHFKNDFYQRIGLRYYLFEHFFAGINIKAKNLSKADYIEWSVGYSIFR